MIQPPKLVLMAGLPGSGKTTLAQKLETLGFLRLSPDERVWQVYGHYGRDFPRGEYLVRERPVLDDIAGEMRDALQSGINVVLDHGFWTTDERRRWTSLGREAGAIVNLVYLPLSQAELWDRVRQRNRLTYDSPNAMYFSEEDLKRHRSRFEPPDASEPYIVYTGDPDPVIQTITESARG